MFKWILLTFHGIKSQEINSFRTDFMDVQVLNKFEEFLLRKFRQQKKSIIGLVSINWKEYIISRNVYFTTADVHQMWTKTPNPCTSYNINAQICHYTLNCFFMAYHFYHSRKKWKDRLEGSLDWLLTAAELEFSKILVPRLPQNLSNVNIECSGKSKQLYSLCSQLLAALAYLNFIFLILICF